MNIEEVAAENPQAILYEPVDIVQGEQCYVLIIYLADEWYLYT